MEQKKIRWGLLGAGAILDRWMKGARQFSDMEIPVIASRTRESAQRMADRYQIPEVATYEELLARPDIDIVYLPVPHTAHKDLAIRAMNAGKSVLVEKPAGINVGQFDEMTNCAQKNQVFFMEAVWTRFFPIWEILQEKIGKGEIGQIRAVNTAFSFRQNASDPSESRLLDPNRAGGGLLDVGVYNLHFCRMIFGKAPVKLMGLASMDTDELHLQVDEQAACVAQYDQGELAIMASGVRTDMEDTAYIYGTEGYIVIPHFWKPQRARIIHGNQAEEISCKVPQKIAGVEDEGYQYEIAYVNECLRRGIKEAERMPWSLSREILMQCDTLRTQWGLRYPSEL